jgi:hypothetical protein
LIAIFRRRIMVKFKGDELLHKVEFHQVVLEDEGGEYTVKAIIYCEHGETPILTDLYQESVSIMDDNESVIAVKKGLEVI